MVGVKELKDFPRKHINNSAVVRLAMYQDSCKNRENSLVLRQEHTSYGRQPVEETPMRNWMNGRF